MPDDKKLDLNSDFGQMDGSDLLKDVAAATEQVKQRKAADRAKAAEQAAKSSSRKTSALIVAIGALLVLLISYWVVFARPGSQNQAEGRGGPVSPSASQSQAVNGQIQQPHVTAAPVAPPRAAPPVGRDSQTVRHPPEGYEQPNYDPGM